jgi:N,N-dimethylformamidase beta subunit-like, C-terminal/Fibronectin type III domain
VPALAAPALADSGAATPAAPTGVTATAGDGAFVVRWQAPQGAISGYRVTPYVDGVTDVPVLTASTATTATLRDLPAGSSYAFSVAAVGVSATGPDSAPSSAVSPGGSNPIVAENRLQGDPLWGDFIPPDDEITLAGYGSKLSVSPGDAIDLYVTTTAPKVTIDVFRMGWYGGAGARKLLALGTFPGIDQPRATPDPVTGMIVERWRRTATLQVPANWITGIYVARLLTPANVGALVIFAVRGDGRSDILFQSSVTTSEAYNLYGGTSLYNNNTDKTVYGAPHATKVSFDRPFANGDGVGYFLSYEYQTLRFLEKNGYDVSYSTDLDTHTGADPLTNHDAFLVVGHDEYWTKAMRDRVEAAIAAGVNVGFLAGNESYWQIRLEPSAAGVPDRVMVGYKDFAGCDCPPGPDPVWRKDDHVLTALWRDPLVGRPETQMMGVMFGGEANNANYVVKNASHWVYAGTGFHDGSVVPGIVGYEYDHYFGGAHTPPGVTVLSDSPVINGETDKPDTANSTIYTAKSGARVFAAGTIQWGWGLDGFGGNGFENAGIQRTTQNILANFTATPAHATVITAPGAPAAVSAAAGDGSAVVSFAPPAADGGSAVTGYRITPYVAGASGVPVLVTASGSTSAVVAGLENGVPTMFTVAAVNRAGAGPESSPTPLVYPAAELPAPPVVVGGVRAGATALLSWAPPLTDGGGAVTSYRVTTYLGGEPQATFALPGLLTFAALPGLRADAPYTFAVAAVNATGAGPGSHTGELPPAGAR